MITADKYCLGNCSIVFNGQSLVYAEKAEVAFEPKVIELPETMESYGALGYLVADRKITVKVQTKHISLDHFEWMSGYSGSRGQAGSAQWVNLDESRHTLPEGSLTIIGKLVDGTPFRLYLARVQAVPANTTSVFSPTEVTQWSFGFVKVTAGTSSIAGRFQIGDIT